MTKSLIKLTLPIIFLLSCSGSDKPNEAATKTEDSVTEQTTTSASSPELEENETWIAQAKTDLAEVKIFETKEASQPVHTLTNPDNKGTQIVFLVDGADVSGSRIPVLLPIPPNGSKGWVDTSDVDLGKNPYKITVELEAHKLTVSKNGEQVINTSVGVGRDGRETPTGLYFIKELLQAPNPNGAYGPYAYGISGFTNSQEVAAEFEGGGIIGIHGTNQPDALGTDVSSGCIRMENSVITDMVEFIPLGTPVEIRP